MSRPDSDQWRHSAAPLKFCRDDSFENWQVSLLVSGMRKIIRQGLVAGMAGIVGVCAINSAAAQVPTGSDPLPQCHRVHSEVGVVVRASGSSKGRKIRSLENGTTVQLAGEALAGTGAVYPQIQKEKDGSYWIKIKTPTAGYVLYTSDQDPSYKYIVPCKQ